MHIKHYISSYRLVRPKQPRQDHENMLIKIDLFDACTNAVKCIQTRKERQAYKEKEKLYKSLHQIVIGLHW